MGLLLPNRKLFVPHSELNTLVRENRENRPLTSQYPSLEYSYKRDFFHLKVLALPLILSKRAKKIQSGFPALTCFTRSGVRTICDLPPAVPSLFDKAIHFMDTGFCDCKTVEQATSLENYFTKSFSRFSLEIQV